MEYFGCQHKFVPTLYLGGIIRIISDVDWFVAAEGSSLVHRGVEIATEEKGAGG